MTDHAGNYRTGCRCEPCRASRASYIRRRNYLNATGRPLTVAAGPTIQHLRKLRAAGGGWNQIADAAACSCDTIGALIRGERTTIRQSTAQRILTLKLADVICERRPVAALGSIRRVRALIAAGHLVSDIIAASGVDRTTMSHLIGAKVPTVRAETHQRIAATFDRMSMTCGTSDRAVQRAKVNGWAPPLAWENPDDPDEAPDYGLRGSRVDAIVEDTAELAEQGLTREAISARLGVAWSTISKAHQRAAAQLPELAA